MQLKVQGEQIAPGLVSDFYKDRTGYGQLVNDILYYVKCDGKFWFNSIYGDIGPDISSRYIFGQVTRRLSVRSPRRKPMREVSEILHLARDGSEFQLESQEMLSMLGSEI